MLGVHRRIDHADAKTDATGVRHPTPTDRACPFVQIRRYGRVDQGVVVHVDTGKGIPEELEPIRRGGGPWGTQSQYSEPERVQGRGLEQRVTERLGPPDDVGRLAHGQDLVRLVAKTR